MLLTKQEPIAPWATHCFIVVQNIQVTWWRLPPSLPDQPPTVLLWHDLSAHHPQGHRAHHPHMHKGVILSERVTFRIATQVGQEPQWCCFWARSLHAHQSSLSELTRDLPKEKNLQAHLQKKRGTSDGLLTEAWDGKQIGCSLLVKQCERGWGQQMVGPLAAVYKAQHCQGNQSVCGWHLLHIPSTMQTQASERCGQAENVFLIEVMGKMWSPLQVSCWHPLLKWRLFFRGCQNQWQNSMCLGWAWASDMG